MSALNDPHQLQLFSLPSDSSNGHSELEYQVNVSPPVEALNKEQLVTESEEHLGLEREKHLELEREEHLQPSRTESILSPFPPLLLESEEILPRTSDDVCELMALQAVLEQRMSSQAINSSDSEKRIFHLEQALDQALIYLKELRVHVKKQGQLEEQLASMEDYAYVQHQAIAHLQNQVVQYQTVLSEQKIGTDKLPSETIVSETTSSEKGCSPSKGPLGVQEERDALHQENAQWKQACQELQQECDRQHRKLVALDQEKAAMQEQILQQVRRLDEGETAIQYWKDQHTLGQQQLQQLLQRLLGVLENSSETGTSDTANKTADVSELLEILNSIKLEQPSLPSLPPSLANSVTLPDFLVRRYQQRVDPLSDSQRLGQGNFLA